MLSVCLPSYNTGTYLAACLESILSQKVDEEFEIVVADDASTDNSYDILQHYKKKLGGKLKIITHKKNTRGLCNQNLIEMYEACEGDYLCRIDSDDIMLPGRLQAQLDIMKSKPEISIVSGNARAFDSDTGDTLYYFNENYYNFSKIPDISTIEHLVKFGTYFCNPASMYRKSSFDVNDIRDIFCELDHYLDLVTHISVASRGDIFRLDKVVIDYRIHNSSVCAIVRDSNAKRVNAHKSHRRIIEFSKRYGIDDEVITIGHAGNDLSASLFFLKSGALDLFTKYIEMSASYGMFFDDRHEKIYRMKNHPEKILSFLNNE